MINDRWWWIVIVVIIGYAIKNVIRINGIHNYSVIKAIGHDDEHPSVLLNRISWANNRNGRVNSMDWNIIGALGMALIANLLLVGSIKNPRTFLITMITFLLLLSFHQYYYNHHSEKFNHCYIQNNIRRIQQKMKWNNDYDSLTYNRAKHQKSMNYRYDQSV